MLTPSDTTALTSDVGSRKLVVNMMAMEGGEPLVRSCEVLQKQFRNRTSFTSAVRLRDVFAEAVAIGLEGCLDRLSFEETEVISLPDFVLDVPGLVLAGAQIMATKRDDGSLSIMFRFRFFLGGINHAFKSDVGFDDFFNEQACDTSTLVLSDIAMPLLDLCAAAESGMFEAGNEFNSFGKKLSEKSHEIKFQIELIKRYIDGLERSRSFQFSSGPKEPHLEPLKDPLSKLEI